MKRFTTFAASAVVLLAAVCGPSQAQSTPIWKWRDAQGRIQVSDRPPPADTPDSRILQRPSGQRPAASVTEPPASPPSSPSPRDPEPEARKRKQQEQEARKKAEQDQAAAAAKQKAQAQREEHCSRVRNQLAALDSGQRMSRYNAKGEREVLDDSARAAEGQRLRNQLAENCQGQ
jgi:hypothetical protein